MSMASTMISLESLNMAVSHQKQTICSSVITLTAENNLLRQSAFFCAIRSSILKTSSYSEETTSVLRSTESMDFTMNASVDTQSGFGKSLVMYSIVCPLPH